MSNNLIADIAEMHTKFGVNPVINGLDPEKLKAFLDFRIRFLDEELNETKKAIAEGDADGIVDGIIDLMVISIGTLDAFGVDAQTAWNRVHAANMSKVVGIKASRPNALGLPDLVKPEGWQAPTHVDNIGLLAKLY
jgi:predicted HAD superfamily Cof-like phosphohydrolase